MKEESKALPKFGDWDLKNPSATEFSIIFDKAREERKLKYERPASNINSHWKDKQRVSLNTKRSSSMVKSNSLLCCFFPSYKS
ncbi:putative RPM1-interacting protein 4/NOI4 [Helianthus anomalus]|nr:putative RPM1-interacting protein 4/NOI4 [Helianthus annuus]